MNEARAAKTAAGGGSNGHVTESAQLQGNADTKGNDVGKSNDSGTQPVSGTPMKNAPESATTSTGGVQALATISVTAKSNLGVQVYENPLSLGGIFADTRRAPKNFAADIQQIIDEVIRLGRELVLKSATSTALGAPVDVVVKYNDVSQHKFTNQTTNLQYVDFNPSRGNDSRGSIRMRGQSPATVLVHELGHVALFNSSGGWAGMVQNGYISGHVESNKDENAVIDRYETPFASARQEYIRASYVNPVYPASKSCVLCP